MICARPDQLSIITRMASANINIAIPTNSNRRNNPGIKLSHVVLNVTDEIGGTTGSWRRAIELLTPLPLRLPADNRRCSIPYQSESPSCEREAKKSLNGPP